LHNSIVEKVLHYKKSDILLVLEQGQRNVSLTSAYSDLNCADEPNSIVKQGKITPILAKKQFILSLAHNESEGTVALTTTQGLIFFYQNIQGRGKFYFRLFKILCACNLSCQLRIWFAQNH